MLDVIEVDGKFLKSLSKKELIKYLDIHRLQLVGGGTFTIGHTLLASTIQKFTKKYAKKDQTFIPTHTGLICLYKGVLVVVNVTPPKVSVQPLLDYILTTDEDFKILYRGKTFELNTRLFSDQALEVVGNKYGYLSAICSILPFKKYINGKGTHCSELFIRLYENQGYFLEYDSDDIVPLEAYNLFKDGKL